MQLISSSSGVHSRRRRRQQRRPRRPRNRSGTLTAHSSSSPGGLHPHLHPPPRRRRPPALPGVLRMPALQRWLLSCSPLPLLCCSRARVPTASKFDHTHSIHAVHCVCGIPSPVQLRFSIPPLPPAQAQGGPTHPALHFPALCKQSSILTPPSRACSMQVGARMHACWLACAAACTPASHLGPAPSPRDGSQAALA